ncbi:MAG: hypothetical protein M3141_07790 [Actinomycetota bacterium]|nr:hypothetical protein [Actinomycetota bacterium]
MPAGRRGRTWTGRTPIVVLLLLLALCALAACGSDDGGADEEKGQVVRFQKPTEPGPDPFTARPTDVHGEDRVEVGSGPYGGTGSDLVCDRELLIRSLKARPERLRAWAKVVDVAPDHASVARYIRKLRPVTLTRDTRVTNHSFVSGRASGYQAILQAGTAVLVDEHGVPRARCRCGNPLLEPIFIPEATCFGCPPHYRPPPECEPWGECYTIYENPPPVKGRKAAAPPPEPQRGPRIDPRAYFSPSSGHVGQAFTLYVSGFSPNATVQFTITRPNGVLDPPYSLTTDSSGSGSYSFRPTGADNVIGTYTATIRDPTGATASATATLMAPERGDGDAQRTTPEPEPEPEPPPDESGGAGSEFDYQDG